MRCGINTGSRNPSVHPGHGSRFLYPALVWFWRSLRTHLGSGKSVPHSCVLFEVMLIRLLFTIHCIGDLVSPAGETCRNLWLQKGVESPGTPVVPRFVSDLMCLFTPESVTSVLTCASVRGAACVGRGWDRLCCWYSRLNFAASAVLLECSSLSIVWGNEGNSFLFGFTLL